MNRSWLPERAENGAATTAPDTVYVDLDGTLIQTDMLWESLISLARHSPWLLLFVPIWMAQGKAALKFRLAQYAGIAFCDLPYCPRVLDRLKKEKAAGKRLVLITGSTQTIAESVNDHLGLFDEVIGSSRNLNLTGRNKLAVIQSAQEGRPFEYWGDSTADLPIFQAATAGLLVRASQRVHAAVGGLGKDIRVIPAERRPLKSILKTLRIHQWAKNILLFMPVIAAHRIFDGQALLRESTAFLVFSFLASGNYIINDLIDLPFDRKHSSKRYRPLASGAMKIPTGIMLAGACFSVAAALAFWFTPYVFWMWLTAYFVITNLYTYIFKHLLVIDLIILSFLYTIRILAGGAVAEIDISEWLLAFSMFFFTSLAFAKRFIEIKTNLEGRERRTAGRAYEEADLDIVRVMGPVSGYLSILVMALYVNSLGSSILYRHPAALWLMCPLLAYWITRIWFVANRGLLHHDPVMFAIRDKATYLVGLCSLIVLTAATM